MRQELLAKYATLYNEAARIEAERIAVRDEIVKIMQSEGQTKQQTPLGTFTVAYKKNWKYSEALVKKEEQLKIAKMREQDKGVAQSTDTPYLLFNSPKE